MLESVPPRGHPQSAAVSAYCIYRVRNSEAVRAFADGLPPGSMVHLHCLDDAPAPELQNETLSMGPGLRMPLLQGLINAQPPREGEAIIIFDDDVSFQGAGGARFPGWAAVAHLDIAQPAHARGSIHAWPINKVVWHSTARLTPWIEIGPVVYLSPQAQRRVLPFPPEAQMGWGVDILWSALVKEGLRLGVVDATPVMHTGALSVAYDMTPEFELLESALAQVGVSAVHDIIDAPTTVWPKWRSRPPWEPRPSRHSHKG